jgi:transcription initiation factor TFIID TATA-box-binding protein
MRLVSTNFTRPARCLRNLVQLGVVNEYSKAGFSTENVVCTEEPPSEVDLTALSIRLGMESVEHDPEQFPRLVYRPAGLPAVVLLFANGAVVITTPTGRHGG